MRTTVADTPETGAGAGGARDPLSLRHVPFAAGLGVVIEHMAPGASRLSLDLKPEHCNSWGAAHGGVVMTLLDICMAVAGRGYDPLNLSGVTVDMSINFIAPGRGRQIALGRVVARGTGLWRCEGEVRNAGDDSLVARAIGTFMFKNFANSAKRPVGDA
ncbi:MAG: PaaI family thioesterase [Burkholderiales bacterium]|nr:PaaI family thioesterase [Burkholderiales bacterium]